jgi:hypothetical protein
MTSILAFSVLLALSPAGGKMTPVPFWAGFTIMSLGLVVIVFFNWLKRRK